MNIIHSSAGMAKTAFSRAAGVALDGWDYISQTYPSKSAAITATGADLFFMYQSFLNGNRLGMASATIGIAACIHLWRYGDPKISADEAASYIDPQDQRSVTNWIHNPKKYPWEFLGLAKMLGMGLMFAGGADIGGQGGGTIHAGEMAAATLSLMGFGVKMFVAEMAKGSVEIPATSTGIKRQFQRLVAHVRENPNPTAAKLWNTSLVPFVGEALARGEYLKLASAALWALPNVLTLYSSKRAKVLAQKPA